MNVLSFDRNVKLNALFHKTSGKKAIVYCDMEMQGEHKVLLDLLVSRLRSQDGVFSAVHIPVDTRSAFPVISVQSPVSIQYRWQS